MRGNERNSSSSFLGCLRVYMTVFQRAARRALRTRVAETGPPLRGAGIRQGIRVAETGPPPRGAAIGQGEGLEGSSVSKSEGGEPMASQGHCARSVAPCVLFGPEGL